MPSHYIYKKVGNNSRLLLIIWIYSANRKFIILEQEDGKNRLNRTSTLSFVYYFLIHYKSI